MSIGLLICAYLLLTLKPSWNYNKIIQLLVFFTHEELLREPSDKVSLALCA